MFKGLNRERLRYLIFNGLDSGDLKRFLDKHRIKLTALGAQYHNRSRGAEADFDFMMRLPPAAEPVIYTWLKSVVPKKPSLQAEAIVAQFETIERQNLTMTREQRHELAADGLAYLVAEAPPHVWLQFLSTPVGLGASESEEATESRPESRPTLGEIAAALVTAPSASPTNDLNRLVSAFLALQDGALSRARELANGIEDLHARQHLETGIAHHARMVVNAPIADLKPVSLPPDQSVDIGDVELIGSAKRRATEDSPAFIRVVAFLYGDVVCSLDHERELEWLDGHPEIIAFPRTPSVRLPNSVELNAWIVEPFTTTQSIKTRVVRNGRPLFTVMQLHTELSQPDNIRQAIKQAAVPAGVRPMFRLTDGTMVRVPSDVTSLADRDFDEPLEIYRNLPSWTLAGARIVPGPLPPPDDHVDCGDIMAVLKRLLRSKEAQQHLPRMTNAQVQAFLGATRENPGGLTLMRLERVNQGLSKIVESNDGLASFVPLLLSSSEIQGQIADAKAAVVAEFVAEESKARTDRDRLVKEIADLNKRRTTAEEALRKSSGEVRNAIKKSFEKARDSGIATLADVAVLSALINERETTDSRVTGVSVRRMAAQRADLSREFAALGAPMVEAKAAELFVKAVLAAGLPIIVRGPLSSQFGLAIGRAVSVDASTVVDVPLGLVGGQSVAPVLAEVRQGDAVIVTSFNLSAYESYGGPITDRILQNLTGSPGTGVHIVLSAVEGPVALPAAVDLESLASVLDTRWLAAGRDVETPADVGYLLGQIGGNVLRANAMSRVTAAAGSFDDPYRRIVNSFLARQPSLSGARAG